MLTSENPILKVIGQPFFLAEQYPLYPMRRDPAEWAQPLLLALSKSRANFWSRASAT